MLSAKQKKAMKKNASMVTLESVEKGGSSQERTVENLMNLHSIKEEKTDDERKL